MSAAVGATHSNSILTDMRNGAVFPGFAGAVLGLQMTGSPLKAAMIGVGGAAAGAISGAGAHAVFDAVPALADLPGPIAGVIAGGALPAALTLASKAAPGEMGELMRSVAGAIAIVSIPAAMMAASGHHPH
jgi:hypothetical protein